MARIESARRLFGSIWFNEETTTAGIEALGWYHEKKDDVRIIGLGPEHDWSSHAVDTFGLMCITAENCFRSVRPMGFKRMGSAIAL
jgi:phage terminase large subunit